MPRPRISKPKTTTPAKPPTKAPADKPLEEDPPKQAPRKPKAKEVDYPTDQRVGDAELDRHRDLLRIDKDNLDEELVRQPTYFADVADRVAWSINVRDGVRELQKEVEARLFTYYKNAEDKVTDKAATLLVEQDPQYIDCRTVYKQATADAMRWEGLREAWRQRGSVLRDLVQLHVTGHYQQTGMTFHPEIKDADEIKRKMAEQRRQRSQ